MTLRAYAMLAFALFLVVMPRASRADETDDLVRSGVSALSSGRASDAIASFESLADRGVVDANMSLDRGLSYALRVKLGADLPGDLGRAAHGFEEARELSTDSATANEATRALAVVRAEVARRRTRTGEAPSMEPGLPLGRSVARIASEDTWAMVALVSSLLLSAGLFVRGLSAARRRRVGGAILQAVAAPALVLSTLLALLARDERLHVKEGVVVAPSAHLTDANHRPLPRGAALPEGARVEIVDTRAGWAHVRWAQADGWITSAAVRTIARPE